MPSLLGERSDASIQSPSTVERSQAVSTPRSATSARDEVRGVAPKLIELSEKVLYADVHAGRPTAMTAGRIARKVFEGAK
jgi:hypothetical protein